MYTLTIPCLCYPGERGGMTMRGRGFGNRGRGGFSPR